MTPCESTANGPRGMQTDRLRPLPLQTFASSEVKQTAWKTYKGVTRADLPGWTQKAEKLEPIPLGTYGGRSNIEWDATGFYRTEKNKGRWWVVDPEGHPFISIGLCGVRTLKIDRVKNALEKKYGTAEKWASSEDKRLREWGFNTLGSWSSIKQFRENEDMGLCHTFWPDPLEKGAWGNGIMNGFGEGWKLAERKGGNHKYANNCMPVFHKDFAKHAEWRAGRTVANTEDKRLLGYFLDNELPFPDLYRFLKLDPSTAGYTETAEKAQEWWKERKGGPSSEAEMTPADKDAWAEFVYDTYYKVTAAAIRKADPNHLILGPRLYGQDKRSQAVLRSAGRHCDVISMNYWDHFAPSVSDFNRWNEWAQKPVIITEFSIRGADHPGNEGSLISFLAEDQKQRADFYEHNILQMLRSRSCVGWHWFGYQDIISNSNDRKKDHNIGLVQPDYSPYEDFVKGVASVNKDVYHLADYFA